jgi:hypothetical protein
MVKTVEVYRNYIMGAVQHLDPHDTDGVDAAVRDAERYILSKIDGLNLTDEQRSQQVALVASVIAEFRAQRIPELRVSDEAGADAETGNPASVDGEAEGSASSQGVSALQNEPAKGIAPPSPQMAAPPSPVPMPRSRGRLATAALTALAGAAIALGYQAFFQSDCRAFSCHDSGWQMLEGRADHILTTTHGFGVIPVGVEVWFSPDEGKTFARLHAASWTHSINPVDTRADAQTVSLHFYRGEPLHKVWTLADGWQTYEKGYFRIITRR